MTVKNESDDNRLIDLEIRYTHQEAVVQDLSEIIRKQQVSIDQLKLDVKRMTAILEGMEASNHERPPHY